MKRLIIFILCFPILFTGCLRNLEKEGITAETIYKGRVVDADNKPLRGIMVRVTNDELIYNSVSTDKDGLFQISVDINKIDKNYYLLIGDTSIFCKRGQLKGFGQDIYDYGDIPFVNINMPEVKTEELVDMTPSSFTCKCSVVSEGAANVTERGVCWSTNIPTKNDNKVISGTGAGSFTCFVNSTDFDFGSRTYYFRAFAVNEYDVAYGDTIEITPSRYAEFMKKKYPTVKTIELTDVTLHSFTCQCEVISEGGATVTERGLCWSASVPTINDYKVKCGVGKGVYSCNISDDAIDFNTMTIYARAYAINEYGETYGDLIEINPEQFNKFMKIKLPTVETVGLTAMTSNSFTCKCNVVSQGKAIVTERGICWSTNIPTIQDNKVKFGGGEGVYSCTVTNLNFYNTTYYARAYAINEYGVSYGGPVEINSSKLAYFSLPTMEYGGYTYHIHPDIGGMTKAQGYDACENLVAYGFDDWYMPNKEEMLGIGNLTNVLDVERIYWSCNYSRDYSFDWYIINRNSIWYAEYNNPMYKSNSIYHVIPVRRDR